MQIVKKWCKRITYTIHDLFMRLKFVFNKNKMCTKKICKIHHFLYTLIRDTCGISKKHAKCLEFFRILVETIYNFAEKKCSLLSNLNFCFAILPEYQLRWITGKTEGEKNYEIHINLNAK